MDFREIQNQRLPTLYELLIQQTLPPVDLWTFYTYLSQYPYAINYLDFWIDLMGHIRLCKEYLNGVRQSLIEETRDKNKEAHIDINDTESDDNISVTTSVLMQTLMNEGHLNDANILNDSYNEKYGTRVSQLIQGWKRRSKQQQQHNNNNSGSNHMNESSDAINISNGNLSTLMDEFLNLHYKERNVPYLTTKELLKNATQICNKYLISPNESPRYLTNIPQDIKNNILDKIINNNQYEPSIFEDIKQLTYQFLEMDCFPKFLSRIALHNLHDEVSDWRFHRHHNQGGNPNNNNKYHMGDSFDVESNEYSGATLPFSNYTTLSRVTFGLLWLFAGFWVGYVLIFINYSRAIRVVTVVPFTLGFYYIICGLYEVDVIYSLFGVTQRLVHRNSNSKESNHLNDNEIMQVPWILVIFGGRSRLLCVEHPFTRRLLHKRGLWCALLIALCTTVFTVVFSCVPGYRL